MKIKDITDEVEFGLNDGESLPLTKCVCGKKFDFWNFLLSEGSGYPSECSECGRKMYFEADIKVYEIEKEND